MKSNFLISFICILSFLSTQAQESKSKSKSRSSVSVSVSSNSTSSSSSTSISSDNDSYSFTSRFSKHKTEKVRDYLMIELGNKNLSKEGSWHEWESIKNDDIAYTVRLSKGRLKIFVDKELVSPKTAKLFERIGEEVSEIISAKKD